LNAFLAHAGIASRRHADALIAAGRVRVNGSVVREMGVRVEPDARVEVDGRPVAPVAASRYLALHKPVGVVTTLYDPKRRRTIADLLGEERGALVPVGRLDYDTSGLLLLTDDRPLVHYLLHPRYGVEKTYRAIIAGRLSPRDVRALLDGVRTPAFRAAGAKVRVVAVRRDHAVIDLTIHEGRNRQVRRMLEALGHPVTALHRLRFGPVALGALPPGAMRPLTEREILALRSLPARRQEPTSPA